MDQGSAEIVASFPMFAGYTPYGLSTLLGGGAVREVQAGGMLFAQGEPAEFVALVISGRLELFVTAEGREEVLTDAGPGRLLGELAVLAGADRVTSARAAENTKVLTWNGTAFRRVLNGDLELSERIFRETFRSIVEERQSLVSALAAARERAGR